MPDLMGGGRRPLVPLPVAASRRRVTLLGAFPPQAQGIADYCGELGLLLSERWDVTALGFSTMYPSLLYPGSAIGFDSTKPSLNRVHLEVRHELRYFDPLGWLRLAASQPTDIFHAQWWSLPLWPVYVTMMAVMRLRHKPVVLTLHNIRDHDRSRLFSLATRCLCGLADRVVVHSPQNSEQLLGGRRVDPSKVYQIPHPSLVSKVRNVSKDRARVALALDHDALVILHFGALRPYKGLDVLIAAFAAIAAGEPRAQLVIAGRVWVDWRQYQEAIEVSGLRQRIHCFLDYIPDDRVPLFFAAADLVVLPYREFDAQSGVAATAAPFAVPMIVTRTGGLPDWVGHEERWIAEPGDVDSLASKIGGFLRDPVGARRHYDGLLAGVLEATGGLEILEHYRRLYDFTPGAQPP